MSQTAPHQAIYRRWRAQTFEQIVGQEAVVETLRNAVRTGRVAHAILFVGPRGTGKTSLARILAKAINCTNLQDGDPCDACPSCVAIREGRAMDLVEIDAASNRGIDAIRELRERINYAPTDLRRKVYILDEAHQITRDAWNALLKSLEEPPEFVVFMFASTHPQDFPPAILSRLQRFDVRRLTTDEIEGKLRRILEADGRAADPAAVHLIARLAAGGMRDAESMLDQLLASSAERLDEGRVRDLLGLADADTTQAFVGALVGGDLVAGVRILDELEDRGRDLRAFLDQVIEVVRGAIVGSAQTGPLPHGVSELLPVARRLATIDPNRAGVGGLRLQLEIALFPIDGVEGRPARAMTGAEASSTSLAPTAVPVAAASAPASPPNPAAGPSSPGRDERARSRARGQAAAASPVGSDPADGPGRGRQATAAPTSAAAPASATAPTEAAAPVEAVSPTQPTTPPRDGAVTGDRRGHREAAAGKAVAVESSAPGAVDTPHDVPIGAQVGDELALLRQRWPEVVARISAHPPTKPLISVCRPIAVEGGIVTLGFPEDQGFLRDVAERRRPVLEEGIGAVLGKPVGVRCVATNLDLVPSLPGDEDAAFILAEARRIFGEDDPDAAVVD